VQTKTMQVGRSNRMEQDLRLVPDYHLVTSSTNPLVDLQVPHLDLPRPHDFVPPQIVAVVDLSPRQQTCIQSMQVAGQAVIESMVQPEGMQGC